MWWVIRHKDDGLYVGEKGHGYVEDLLKAALYDFPEYAEADCLECEEVVEFYRLVLTTDAIIKRLR